MKTFTILISIFSQKRSIIALNQLRINSVYFFLNISEENKIIRIRCVIFGHFWLDTKIMKTVRVGIHLYKIFYV
jgi:hypothetical protein